MSVKIVSRFRTLRITVGSIVIVGVFSWLSVPPALASTNSYAGGNGTPSHPYQIATPQQLANMDHNLLYRIDLSNTCYELTANIDMSTLNAGQAYAGWVPIPGYSGVFNGNGFHIENLYLFTSNQNTALFKSTSTAAVIENLLLQNISVTGNDYQTTATLVSNNAGTVSNVGVTGGSVNGGGYTSNGSLVANNSGTIENDYSTVSMLGQSGSTNGGLVGSNTGMIKDSYNAGSVSSGGGLVGSNTGSIVDSYYNSDLATSSAGGTPLSTAEMQQQSNFRNWGFGTIWSLASTMNYGYPYLRIPAPTNLHIQGQTSSTVTVSWNPVLATSAYQVSLDGQTLHSNWTGKSYAFQNLTSGKSYSISVQPVATDGRLGTPAVIQFNLPAVPTNLEHTNLHLGSWTESWTPTSGVSSYNVWLNGTTVGTVTSAVYDFTGENPQTTYQVQVSSINASGLTSSLSAVDSVITAVYGGGRSIPHPLYRNSSRNPRRWVSHTQRRFMKSAVWHR